MVSKLRASITSDIDTLSSIYKGRGLKIEEYSYAELSMGLDNFSRFLDKFGVKATLFMVGNDFTIYKNHTPIKNVIAHGHEIGNHTMTHPQGFRDLSVAEKIKEIESMSEICFEVTGIKPLGFRAPGWNIADDTFDILERLGYIYDSSIHPTFLMPLLKFLHWNAMSNAQKQERTTMGRLKYMFLPDRPYYIKDKTIINENVCSAFSKSLIEFPLTVTPCFRLPFFATFLLATGIKFFNYSLHSLVKKGVDIQFQFHLSDFVDYSHKSLRDQIPRGEGLYIPKSIHTSLNKKIELFTEAMYSLSQHYNFTTLKELAIRMNGGQSEEV